MGYITWYTKHFPLPNTLAIRAMPDSVTGDIKDRIDQLREKVYQHYGKGALTQLAEDMGEPYVEVCKALGETNAERLRRVEEIVEDK